MSTTASTTAFFRCVQRGKKRIAFAFINKNRSILICGARLMQLRITIETMKTENATPGARSSTKEEERVTGKKTRRRLCRRCRRAANQTLFPLAPIASSSTSLPSRKEKGEKRFVTLSKTGLNSLGKDRTFLEKERKRSAFSKQKGKKSAK